MNYFTQWTTNLIYFQRVPSSSLHLGLASGSGPQSSTSSSSLGGLSSLRTQVLRPQKGLKSQDLPGSTVAHRVLAKHIPGKSVTNQNMYHISKYTYVCRKVDQLNMIHTEFSSHVNVEILLIIVCMVGSKRVSS